MKRKWCLTILSITVATLIIGLSACEKKDPELTVKSDGSYAFNGNGSSYVIQVFHPEDVSDGTPVSGKEALLTTNIVSAEKNAAGTMKDFDTIPYGEYISLLYSIDSNYNKELADETDFIKKGKLSVPEFNFTAKEFIINAELSSGSIGKYMNGELLTSYSVQIFDNQECTGDPLAEAVIDGNTIEETEEDSGFEVKTVYTNNSVDLELEGTIGVEQDLYIRAIANADNEGLAEASDYTEVTELKTDGKYALRTGAIISENAVPYTEESTYKAENVEYTKNTGFSEMKVKKDYKLAFSADGSYTLYEKDLAQEGTDYTESEKGNVKTADTYFLYFTYMSSENDSMMEFMQTEGAEETEQNAMGYFNNELNSITMLNSDNITITLIRK